MPESARESANTLMSQYSRKAIIFEDTPIISSRVRVPSRIQRPTMCEADKVG